jgi:multidrug efflux pump subunit AcrA (membrane-fusion protein)
MSKQKKIIAAVGVLLAAVSIYFFWNKTSVPDSELYATVKRGDFKVTVTTTGELDAKSSVKIMGPSGLGDVGLWQVKINKIIPEGTVVKKGDFVAELDQSELINKMTDRNTELSKTVSQFTQTKLDTALDLRQTRDNLLNLQFTVEEKQIKLEQSAYEPPATIKQAKIELDKSVRDLAQAKENYKIKVRQAQTKMDIVAANLAKEQSSVNSMKKLMDEFFIKAPETGMLVYHRDWDGKKKREGSTIQTWNPIVATLPDLSSMISKTYINEIDIRKLKKGQSVEISLDAFPSKKLTGIVNNVANVGEQKPNSDAKVFEVEILVNEKDTTLRPAMTTGNAILTDVVKNVLSAPLECLHAQGDTVTYVYKKTSTSYEKREVKTGASNENEVVITEGLEENDVLMLSVPASEKDKPSDVVRLPKRKK